MLKEFDGALSPRMMELLQDLSEDVGLRYKYQTNPAAVASNYGLSSEEYSVVVSRDQWKWFDMLKSRGTYCNTANSGSIEAAAHKKCNQHEPRWRRIVGQK